MDLGGRARDIAMLTDVLAAGRVLVLTGAGISTDSGIPDYRGPDARPRHSGPMTYQEFVGSEAARQRYWARSHLGWERIATARPNVSHRAVAALEQAGLATAVVTQNVDGLHSAAGTRQVVDLHGRLDSVVCLGCGDRRPRLEVGLRLDVCNPGFRPGSRAPTCGTPTVDAPTPTAARPDGDVLLTDDQVAGFVVVGCRRCGGVLKPDVVFFGEHVPRERFQRSLRLLEAADSLLVLGSSLTVGSGYRMVTAAVRRGIPVLIVNRGATRGDRHSTLKVDASLADVLPDAACLATIQRRLEGRADGYPDGHPATDQEVTFG